MGKSITFMEIAFADEGSGPYDYTYSPTKIFQPLDQNLPPIQTNRIGETILLMEDYGRPIFLSLIVLFLTPERSESAFVTIHGDDFQIPVLRESGQYDCSFKSRNFRLLTIVLKNVPLSQNIDRQSCFINPFSMVQHVFKITE